MKFLKLRGGVGSVSKKNIFRIKMSLVSSGTCSISLYSSGASLSEMMRRWTSRSVKLSAYSCSESRTPNSSNDGKSTDTIPMKSVVYRTCGGVSNVISIMPKGAHSNITKMEWITGLDGRNRSLTKAFENLFQLYLSNDESRRSDINTESEMQVHRRNSSVVNTWTIKRKLSVVFFIFEPCCYLRVIRFSFVHIAYIVSKIYMRRTVGITHVPFILFDWIFLWYFTEQSYYMFGQIFSLVWVIIKRISYIRLDSFENGSAFSVTQNIVGQPYSQQIFLFLVFGFCRSVFLCFWLWLW